MHVALIADTFPPLRSSGAVQLRDLSHEFVRQGHTITVMLPSSGLSTPWLIEDFNGVYEFNKLVIKYGNGDYSKISVENDSVRYFLKMFGENLKDCEEFSSSLNIHQFDHLLVFRLK